MFKIDSEEELDLAEENYAQQLELLTYDVLLKYISDPTIDKPRLKPLVELSQRINDDNFDVQDDAHKLLIDQVLIAVNISPLFQAMVKETVDKFNNDLLEDSLTQMSPEEIDELLKYLDESAEIMQKNIKTLEDTKDRFDTNPIAFGR